MPFAAILSLVIQALPVLGRAAIAEIETVGSDVSAHKSALETALDALKALANVFPTVG